MTFNWEITPTLFVAVILQLILLVVGYVRTTDRTSASLRMSEEAKLQTQALNASFNLFQVSVARDYVSREVLKEFEARITIAAKENVDRLAREISELRDVILSGRTARSGVN